MVRREHLTASVIMLLVSRGGARATGAARGITTMSLFTAGPRRRERRARRRSCCRSRPIKGQPYELARRLLGIGLVEQDLGNLLLAELVGETVTAEQHAAAGSRSSSQQSTSMLGSIPSARVKMCRCG